MAAEEQERVANEEAEKRLKAALAAKRERDPSMANSRVASPAVGDAGSSETPPVVDPKPGTQEVKSSEDVVMENGNGDSQAPAVSPAPEVSTEHITSNLIVSPFSHCWFHLESLGSRDKGIV